MLEDKRNFKIQIQNHFLEKKFLCLLNMGSEVICELSYNEGKNNNQKKSLKSLFQCLL